MDLNCSILAPTRSPRVHKHCATLALGFSESPRQHRGLWKMVQKQGFQRGFSINQHGWCRMKRGGGTSSLLLTASALRLHRRTQGQSPSRVILYLQAEKACAPYLLTSSCEPLLSSPRGTKSNRRVDFPIPRALCACTANLL